MTNEHDFEGALDYYERLTTCPAIWQAKINEGCRTFMDRFNREIGEALTQAAARQKAGDGMPVEIWACGYKGQYDPPTADKISPYQTSYTRTDTIAEKDAEIALLRGLLRHAPDGDALEALDKLKGWAMFEIEEFADIRPLENAYQTVKTALTPKTVPEGYKLVPIEPTREMWAAAGNAIGELRRKHGTTELHHDILSETVYQAMVEAAIAKEENDG